MATIREIAREAGVGLGTASRALQGSGCVSEEKRKRVREAAERLGYVPPGGDGKKKKQPSERGTGGRRTSGAGQKGAAGDGGAIGVLLPDVSLPFYGNYLKYVQLELENAGYRTMIFNTLGQQRRVAETLALLGEGLLDGLIMNADAAEDELAQMDAGRVVSFERMLGNGIPLVASDHRRGGQLAAKLLISSGCKNVMIIGARHHTPVYADIRIGECSRILKKHNIPVTGVEIRSEDYSFQSCGELISEYLDRYPWVDGIFTDDVEAYCALSQAKKRGIRVPRDLKIVGYDGSEITRMIEPQVTTIAQNMPMLARTSVEVLLKKLNGQETEERYLIPVEIQKGGTT